MSISTANNNHKANKQANPAMQLINLFQDNQVNAELIFNYHERLSSLPANAINPTAKGSNYHLRHTANGFICHRNNKDKQT